MKRLFLALSVGIGLVACGDSTEGTPGGTLDSNVTTPVPDNTRVEPDTTLSDTGTILDLNNKSDTRDGTSSGEAGSSTNSENSGSAKDDNKGTN